MKEFRKIYGWDPDYEFEVVKCNKTDEEQVKIIAKGVDNFKRALSSVLNGHVADNKERRLTKNK